MQPNGPVPDADRGGDKSNPTILANRRLNLDIECKAAPVFDRIGAKAFHLRAGVFAIVSDHFLPDDLHFPRQSEDVVDPPRPGEGIVGKIAFPASGMMQVQSPNLHGLNHVGDGAAEDMAELKVPGLLPKGPRVLKSDGIEIGQCCASTAAVISRYHGNRAEGPCSPLASARKTHFRRSGDRFSE